MTGYTSFLAHLLLVCTLASAITDSLWIDSNSTGISCHYVSNHTGSAHFLSQNQEPFIQARLGRHHRSHFRSEDEEAVTPLEWSMDVMFISKPDLQIVNVDKGRYVYWEGDYDIYNDTASQKFSLDEVLAANMNQSAITTFKLTPESNITGRYPLSSSGDYCAVLTFTSNRERGFTVAEVKFIQPHGELDKEDYIYIYVYIFSGLVYFVSSIVYFYYVFLRRKQTTNDYRAIGETRSQLKNAEIQLRILLYMFGSSIVYLFLAGHLNHKNANGQMNFSTKESFLELTPMALTTLFFCWALYSLLLMSSGYLFTSEPKDRRIVWFIRLVTISSFVSGLLSDFESAFSRTIYGNWDTALSRGWHNSSIVRDILSLILFLEYVVSFVFGSYFAIKTYSDLCFHGRNATANRFLATVVIIIVPTALDGIGRDVIYIEILSSLVDNIIEFRPASHIFHLAATVAVAFLWRDTSLESEMVLKQE
ncbi:unnamed protein product [Kuraishia capsulata CBS 1993]|uniref:Intimal thickness related receptor IRP domain-containing protein n=1 Tax=Kuraishia capsulata CBS 1993 TaxID=1382522 RepID=W6MWY3_9ASCO|nr:uncharacterized protein KUCA_T00003975001 [Kuraishia capsulata CBS 1993]CDK27995.1 unnamed protein product [Kuraishia capsulata CBS 1993]